MKLDKFVLAIIAAVLVAWVFPYAVEGMYGTVLDYASTAGIFLIFFFYALRLSTEKIMLGIRNWRLHILVQASTFLIFPLLILALYPLIQNGDQEVLWLGLFFMAAVPSTVSSSVVMVSIGKGNIPAAIFNASISGLLGVLVTPLWMGLFLQQSPAGFDFTEVYMRLVLVIILPVVVGLLLRRSLYRYAVRYISGLALFDKSVILLIVYISFARSFMDEVFNTVNLADLIMLVVSVILIFYLVYGIIYVASVFAGLNREDRITALFCGSNKSLVHGTVFASVLFADHHAAGLILVPLMLFHSWQIFMTSILAGRYGRQME